VRKILISVLLLALIAPVPAHAHQPVTIANNETTAARGPLLVDGTVSFAVRAAFTKSGQKKGFRFNLKQGEQLNFEYLIIDKAPENKLKNAQFPQVVITAPNGSKTTVRFNERSKFSYSGTNYLYLYRNKSVGQSGTYNVDITAKARAAITLVVGEKEIPGDVIRGAAATSKPSPSATPSSTASALTMDQVKKNNTVSSCWSVINGNVYNLTNWISSHPGGSGAITRLCGTDGTKVFSNQHRGDTQAESRLSGFLLGKLTT
jgi:cytochrome b involved in lipid metabolism